MQIARKGGLRAQRKTDRQARNVVGCTILMYNCCILVTPKQKGDALEAVVAAIEGLILEASPSAKDKRHLIESKKIVTIGGVRNEVDLHVTTDIAPGYKAVFIFECKNWEEAVGKNEIIVFSEKIDVCSAQHGFFVAKSFTSDAEAQAKKDPRITLRTVTEHDPVSTIVPFGFQYTFQEPKKIRVKFKKWGTDGSKVERLDLAKSHVLLNGATVDFLAYLNEWTVEAINESMRTFPSGTLEEGIHSRSCQSMRRFAEGQLSIDSSDIELAESEVDFEIHLKRPRVVSHFEVGGRGRVISFEGHTLGSVTVDSVQFILGPSAPND